MPTAAVIIIGNEILSGKFRDENAPFLIRRLREIGADLRRIATVPDVLDEIAEEVRRCAERYDHVFTSGGVGPTHDDVTMAGIAQAFGTPLRSHQGIVDLLHERLDGPPNAAALRMAELPEGAELMWDGDLWFPLVRVRNVNVFPGVPGLLRRKFEASAHRWAGSPVVTARVVTAERETAIAERLAQAQARWTDLEIGSYPRYEDGPFHVIATVEGRDPAAVEACRAWLAEVLLPLEA